MPKTFTSRDALYAAFARELGNQLGGCSAASITAPTTPFRSLLFCPDCGDRTEVLGQGKLSEDPNLYVL